MVQGLRTTPGVNRQAGVCICLIPEELNRHADELKGRFFLEALCTRTPPGDTAALQADAPRAYYAMNIFMPELQKLRSRVSAALSCRLMMLVMQQ